MRILINTLNFSPELTGIGKYSGEMAEWLAMQGHEVRVVTAPPYYPQWRIADKFSNTWSRTTISKLPGVEADLNGNLTVYRCPLWVPASPSAIKRILHLASFALSSFPVMLSQIFWRPDVVWVVEPPLFCAPQAWLVARLSGAKAWLHIQDFEVDAAFELGLLGGRRLRASVAWVERWMMRRFDRVSTISRRMQERVLSKGVDPSCSELFQNWVKLSGVDAGAQRIAEEYRRELGIASEGIVALYSGNMGGKQGLEILADAARLLQQRRQGESIEGDTLQELPPVVFVFCGNGAAREELIDSCNGLENVKFMNLQPVERLEGLLAMANIHLLPQRSDAADLVMPSKLTGMLASGRPVVATAAEGTELANVVADCGLVVKPGDVCGFLEAITLLAKDADLRARLGKAGREYALLNLDKERVLGGFEVKLEALVSK